MAARPPSVFQRQTKFLQSGGRSRHFYRFGDPGDAAASHTLPLPPDAAGSVWLTSLSATTLSVGETGLGSDELRRIFYDTYVEPRGHFGFVSYRTQPDDHASELRRMAAEIVVDGRKKRI